LKYLPPSQDFDNFNIMLWIARWLKWHDSRRLWDAVLEQGDKTFIPQKVIWAYQRETKKHKYINGYLDFARTIRNPLCLDIYKNALARIWGILPSVRMENLDLLTMTVLKDIQAEGVYGVQNGNEKYRLKVGSVLVSGVTWYAEEEPEIRRVLHFFMHENTEGYTNKNSSEKNMATLLFWTPGKDIKNDDDLSLRRIGKTAFIAPQGWKSYEIPRFDKSGKVVGHRTPSDTYKDWQVSYPSIVKMGHWVYQEHHDFLTINIREVIKIAFVAPKPDELAGFLANNILVHLGMKKGDLIEKYKDLIEENQSNKNQSAKPPGILVYRSHPNTDFIIRKLLEMLVEEEDKLLRTNANQRIFPILPVRVRWGGSTLLMPPLMREEIRKVLEKAPSTPILIFDDAIISGRTLYSLHSILTTLIQDSIEDNAKGAEQVFNTPDLEIEKSALARLVEIAQCIPEQDTKPADILDSRATISGNSLRDLQQIINTTIQNNSPSKAGRSLVQTPVSMMVIVNRMRLPTDIGVPLKYYWRQDVPTLGKDGSCPLCHAINMAEKFKGSLASKASQNTLEEWIAPWKASSPIENWNLGLPPRSLPDVQEKDFCYRHTEKRFLEKTKLKLTHSTGLAIHASELHSMTGDNEYFLRHVSEFPSEIQIELVASQLFLFAYEFDVKTKIKAVQHLLKALIKDYNTDMMHTGLALLAAMRGTASLDIGQQRKIVEGINDDGDDEIEKLPSIFLAWMVKENLLTQNDEAHKKAYEIGCGMLRSKASLLNCLVKELFSYNGYPHSGAIPRLRDTLKDGTDPKEKAIEDALTSFGEIAYLDEEIKKFHLVRQKTSGQTFQQTWRELQTKAEEALAEKPINKKTTAEILDEYIDDARKQIIEKYFFPIPNLMELNPNDSTSKFQETIGSIIEEIIGNQKIDKNSIKIRPIEFKFGTQAGEVWIPWYDAIFETIKNAVSNVRHAKNGATIQNPWSTAPDSETRKMWIRIRFENKSVRLAFANEPKSPTNYNTCVHLHPDRWSPLVDIGGKVEVKTCLNNVLIVEITIPYAVHLIQKENAQ
jgi:hypothetical protein